MGCTIPWYRWTDHGNTAIKESTAFKCLGTNVPAEPFECAEERDAWLLRLRREKRSDVLKYMPALLRADKRFWFQAVLINGWALKFAATEITADKELMLAAVRVDGIMLDFAAHHLKRDRELVLAAVRQDPMAMLCCDPVFWTDSEIAVMAVRANGLLLGLAPRTIKSDREIVLEIVQQHGLALEHADDVLKDDVDVVLAAVQSSGHALQYASDNLRADKRIALAALRQAGSSFLFCDESLKSDKDVLLAAVRQDGWMLKHADNSLRSDEEVVLAALENMGLTVPESSTVKDMMLLAVQHSGHALELAPDELRADRGVVLEAIKARPSALKFAKGGLDEDYECLKAAGRAIEHKNSLHGRTEKVILSVKGLGKPSDSAGRLAMAMRADPVLGQFKTYNPDISRGSCDPLFTDVCHPCRGTSCTCGYTLAQNVYRGRPCSKSCWRYMYRFHQKECKTSNGFMVQLEEESGLDDGQIIQSDMATSIGLKMFRIELRSVEMDTLHQAVNMLSHAVQLWYKAGGEDLSPCTVTAPLEYDIVEDDHAVMIKDTSVLPGGGAEFTVEYFSA